jgi:hypothetical protein
MAQSTAFVPDMGAFPVLRLDQIPRIDSDTLLRSKVDSQALITDLERENETPPKLVFYLRRQLESIDKELALRAADARIKSIFQKSHSEPNLYPSGMVIDVVTVQPTPREPTPIRAGTELREQVQEFSYVPLPSQTRSQAATSEPTFDKNLYRKQHRASEDMQPFSAASESRNPGREHTPVNETLVLGTSGGPSKKSVEVLYQDFGSQFIVAATERRKRFYPKRKVEETNDKESDRLERYYLCLFCPLSLRLLTNTGRRNAALKRLSDRRQNRESIKQVRTTKL